MDCNLLSSSVHGISQTRTLKWLTSTGTQLKCPSTEEWIKKAWYTGTVEYYSAMKRNEIVAFAEMWMDLETVIWSEVSQKDKNKYHIISLICGVYKKMI